MEERVLLKARRLTLIRSMLSEIPVYYLSLFWTPSSVCKNIEKYMKDFPCGGGLRLRLPSSELGDGGVPCESRGLEIGNLRIYNRNCMIYFLKFIWFPIFWLDMRILCLSFGFRHNLTNR